MDPQELGHDPSLALLLPQTSLQAIPGTKVEAGPHNTRKQEEIEMLKCEQCGATSPEVVETCCPFAMEIYDEMIPMNLCPDCYQERCDDI